MFRKRSGSRYIVESTSDKKELLKNENVDEKTLLKNENADSYLTYSFTEEIRKNIPNRYSFQIVEPNFDENKTSQKLTLKEQWRTSKLRSVLG